MSIALLGCGIGSGMGTGGAGYPGGAEAQAFFARTSGLDTTHQNAYAALIDGLVADGVWTLFDILYMYATQDATTALLNLKSSSFNATAGNSPTFTTDRGFTGSASPARYIDSNYNPTTAGGAQFVQNSCHLSVWNVTNTGSATPSCGNSRAPNIAHYLYAQFSGDTKPYYRCGVAYTAGEAGSAGAGTGHFLASRTSSVILDGYKNGSSDYSSGANASQTLSNGNIYGHGNADLASGVQGCVQQLAMFSLGAGLSSTDASNFYTRVRTYMTVVGVP